MCHAWGFEIGVTQELEFKLGDLGFAAVAFEIKRGLEINSGWNYRESDSTISENMPVESNHAFRWNITLSDALAGKVFAFSLARPWMRGSSRAAEGEQAMLHEFTSSSLISLCRKITRPPFLHESAGCLRIDV